MGAVVKGSTKIFRLNLPIELKKQLEVAAKQDRRSVTATVVLMIEQYLAERQQKSSGDQ